MVSWSRASAAVTTAPTASTYERSRARCDSSSVATSARKVSSMSCTSPPPPAVGKSLWSSPVRAIAGHRLGQPPQGERDPLHHPEGRAGGEDSRPRGR